MRWEDVQDARTLIRVAILADVARATLVRAACACARVALVHVPVAEHRPRAALEAAEAWARGGVRLTTVHAAARAAALCVLNTSDAAGAAIAASVYAAGSPLDVEINANAAVRHASDACAWAARAAHRATERPARHEAWRHTADVVRAHVPFALVATKYRERA